MMVAVPTRLQQVTICTPEFLSGLAFYDAALGALGLARVAEFGDEEEGDPELEAAAWSVPDAAPLLWLVTGATPTSGGHLCLRVDSRDEVEAFYAAALAAGGTPHDAPRRWTLYRRGEFAATVADPHGNLVEAVTSE
jgi:catechol 2,3-dioxygenase-like lactoylglutathione lyase family enzyme